MKTHKIIIVGGGIEGWITATTLIKLFPKKDITLIDKHDSPSQGLAQSHADYIKKWIRLIGLEDKEFIKAADATYRLSTEFKNFYKKDYGSFHYPNGIPSFILSHFFFNDWIGKKALHPNLGSHDFAETFWPIMQLVLHSTYSENKHFEFEDAFLPIKYTSYNWDPDKFGNFLKSNHCLNKGVKYIVGDITDTKTTKEGLEEIVINGSQCLKADFFIDCSGPDSLLLGKSMKVSFNEYKDILINDSIITCHLPYKNKQKELTLYNTTVAYNNGWISHIPLWSGINLRYTFSSKYTSKGKALNEFIEYIKTNFSNRSLKDIELKERTFKSGSYNKIWVKNVCAIGSSAGELEPLQNNSLFTVVEFLKVLSKTLWCKEDINQFDKDTFNATCLTRFRNLAEFTSLLFKLSVREDTKYWKHITNQSTPLKGRTDEMLDKYCRSFEDVLHQRMTKGHFEDGIACMAFGMNYFPKDLTEIMWDRYHNDIEWHKPGFINALKTMEAHYKMWKKEAKKAPLIYTYLKNNFYGK